MTLTSQTVDYIVCPCCGEKISAPEGKSILIRDKLRNAEYARRYYKQKRNEAGL